MEKTQDFHKTPMPPEKSKLHLPMPFWSSVLATLDMKIQAISETYGFGKVNVSFVVHRGKVTEIYFTDETRVRGLIEYYEENQSSVASENQEKPMSKTK